MKVACLLAAFFIYKPSIVGRFDLPCSATKEKTSKPSYAISISSNSPNKKYTIQLLMGSPLHTRGTH